MREIIKVMLQEGISEEVIHECLDVIEEGYNLRNVTIRAKRKGQDTSKAFWKAGEIPGTNDFYYVKNGETEKTVSSGTQDKEKSKTQKGQEATDDRKPVAELEKIKKQREGKLEIDPQKPFETKMKKEK